MAEYNTLTVIRQGDQYKIPMTVSNNGTIITAANADAMRIMLGRFMAVYPDGELDFDNSTGKWLFPLTQQMSYALKSGAVFAQAQYKIGDSIITTEKAEITVEATNFPQEW